MKACTPKLQSRFEDLKCCILIPTFNNAGTLERVLDELLHFSKDIIVVNDGSTDHTDAILEQFRELICVIDFEKNKGKGDALKTGFQVADRMGFQYAISMDSDGQHYPDDLEVFLEALERRKQGQAELLAVGSRKMNHPSIPDKSSFGNRCSSFWYKIETGIGLEDTQCGYRLYPLHLVNNLKLKTRKYELEIEVLVKAAWKGAEVVNLPVKVLYDPLERVTHFRPFQDVIRIALLNIWFVFWAFCYILPRNFFRRFRKAKKLPAKQTSLSDSNLPAG